MTPENFVYWLQGYFEISDGCNPLMRAPGLLGGDQIQIIRDHLKLVLEKKTPDKKMPFSITNPFFSTVNPTEPVYHINSPSPPVTC